MVLQSTISNIQVDFKRFGLCPSSVEYLTAYTCIWVIDQACGPLTHTEKELGQHPAILTGLSPLAGKFLAGKKNQNLTRVVLDHHKQM